MDKGFGGVIWTNHALDRMKDRGIKQGDAWATWRNPEQSREANIPGAWIYFRTYGSERIEVVAKKNEKSEWVILSVWSRSVYEGNSKVGKPKGHESIWKLMLKQILGR
ncbi:hypothetical protein A3E15_02025 [Candidatus Woesebacteria bacterium RIFCSPHIGHO2_12_FULL_42_9]|uniref:DUF4258 domain-containing protein n=2 Tax=Candidatus Woeseibacteriota TaxID=1752722 RepID=A0A1F8AX21_9BACT|nr:MAG: hypothetical protein UT23_C0041G0006 [Candidatus Woesebacteria bacterium GW2011_GWA1_39_12]OGM56303.1 MAG: hypothetical protein A3E15_02025 [Candidatus Woesebacteria bacterium RIFCSPHIGHO2_12_FULL_42_9]